MAQTSLPESLNKKLSSLSQHKTVRSQEINHAVWQSMDSLATSVHTASPVSVMAALETPLSAMSSTLRQEASYLPENSTGSTSTVQNSSAYNYSSPNLNTYDIEHIASAVVDKMIQTLSLFLVSKAASSKTQSDTSSISNESHLNNLQKNLNNIDAQKTLNNLNTITNIVRDVEKNIVSSVSAISEVTQTINNYTHAAISHIQKQGQEALNNLVEIYTGNLGLITKAQVELETFQEERQTEEEQRRKTKEEQEYAYQQSVYEKELLQLEAVLAGETNIRNAKKLEQEIENKRRKKREQEEQRLSDLAEAKRQEELDQKEQELLKAKQLREWEYEVQKTQIQNAVGQAQAEAEHQVAIITKVTQTAQLTGQIAMASANAAINMANPINDRYWYCSIGCRRCSSSTNRFDRSDTSAACL